MALPPLDPPINDEAPAGQALTAYDREHLITYLRLLDAEAAGADWREVAMLVLHIEPATDPIRARTAWRTHLERAHWLRENGYHHVLQAGRSR